MARKLKEEYAKWDVQFNIYNTQYICIDEKITGLNIQNYEIIKNVNN